MTRSCVGSDSQAPRVEQLEQLHISRMLTPRRISILENFFCLGDKMHLCITIVNYLIYAGKWEIQNWTKSWMGYVQYHQNV